MIRITRVLLLFSAFVLSSLFSSQIANALPPAPVAKTGQTGCWDASGTPVACGGTGQDGMLQNGFPRLAQPFTDNGDGTITDNLTGLMWSKDGNPSALPLPWQGALNFIKSLNSQNYQGYNDWRLPNINEMRSVANYQQASIYGWVNSNGFNVPTNYYWSSDSVPAGPTASGPLTAWYIGIGNDSVVGKTAKSNNNLYFWPVRAGQPVTPGSLNLVKTGQNSCWDATGQSVSCPGTGQDGDTQAGAAWPNPRFSDNGDQTITDNATGLVWSRDANAPGPAGCTTGNALPWQAALNYVKCLNSNAWLGRSDWRLPNINELASRFNGQQNRQGDWLTASGFTNVQFDTYWSSTSLADSSSAWYLDLIDSSVTQGSGGKNYSMHAWPVRGGQYRGVGALVVYGDTTPGNSPIGQVAPFGVRQLEIKNLDTAAAAVSALSLSGSNASEFSITPGGTAPCASLTPTLAAGASCTLTVSALPTTLGAKTASIAIASAGQNLDIPLSTTAITTVYGTVTDQATGLPLSGATVTLLNGPSVTTAADGSYTFAALAPGTYYLTGTASGYQSTTAGNLMVSPTQSARADIRLYPATTRFIDTRDGTLIDTQNNLNWLKDGNCTALNVANTWYDAVSLNNSLVSGKCGLTDGSRAGDWHLPSVGEYHTLVDTGYHYDTLNAAGFSNVQANWYWASTEYDSYTAWDVFLGIGNHDFNNLKGNPSSVWSVRSGNYWKFDSLIVSSINGNFGLKPVSVITVPRSFTLNNSGVTPLAIGSLNITGPDAGQFSIAPGGGAPCANLSPTIMPGASCSVSVAAVPTSNGIKTGALTVTAGGSSYYVPLTVTGYPTVIGSVIDQSTNLPVAGASVSLSGGASTKTAADGTFSFASLSAGTYSITVADAGYQSITVGNLAVNDTTSAQADILLPTTGPLNINTAVLPSATAATAYTTRVLVAGGSAPYAFNLSYGNLPAGLALDTKNGVISGTPSGSGSYTFAIGVTDSASNYSEQEYTINLVAPLVITTASLNRTVVGTSYPVSITATGGAAPLSFAITSGSLPAGLTLSAAGVFTGIPTATGNYPITVTVTDSSGRSTGADFILGVDAPLVIGTARLNDARQTVAYSFTPAASGGYGALTWSLFNGTLPAGLSFDPATGTISGTATEAVTRIVTLMVTDSIGRSYFQNYPLNVSVPVGFATTALPNAYVNGTYSELIRGQGGIPPYSYSMTGTLPTGLSFANGAVSGTASSASLKTIAVTITDSSYPAPQTLTQNFSLRSTGSITPATSAVLANARKGTAITPVSFAAAGGTAPYAWSHIGGALPGGIVFDPAAATLSGTPTDAGDFSFTLHLADSLGNATGVSNNPDKTFVLHVSDTLALTTGTLPSASLNLPYSTTLASFGGLKPVTWSIAAGALPAGLSLNPSTGQITGTPSSTATASFTVQCADSDVPAQSAAVAYSFPVGSSMTLVESALPAGRTGIPYSANVRVQAGTAPYQWSVSAGALPSGFSLVPGNGSVAITGTPGAAGSASFTLQVVDSSAVAQTFSRQFSISTLPSLALTSTVLPPATAGASYSQTIASTGGQGPYSFVVTSGSLPGGLFLNSVSGAVSGTLSPASQGSSFTITVTDSGIPTASVSKSFSIAALVAVPVVKSSAAAGTVTSTPAGINCDTACSSSSGSFAAGTGVTITAYPSTGYFLAGWAGCDSSAGNSCTVSARSGLSLTASFSRQMASSLSIGPPVTSIKQNAPVTLTGVLGTVPLSSGSYLAGQSVTVAVTKPDGSLLSYTATTADNNGSWSLQLPAIFSAAGSYLVSASFAGSDQLINTGSPSVSILMDKSAGYAIVVTGMRSDASLLNLHNNTANAVVNTLKSRGFLDANILVLESSASAAVTPDQVGTAITSWAKGKLADTAAPLYLIMVDHGSAGAGFVMGNSILTPVALKGYLDTLEGDPSVAAAVASYQRFVIIGTCYSGQFIPVLSAPGRVIITSAGPAEESIANITMYDATSRSTYSSGEYFVDSLFSFLGRGSTFQDAFTRAAGALPGKDVRRSASNSFRFGVWDNLMQHPLLDDAGSGSGSYQLGAGSDGALVASLKLGVGVATNGGDNPADIKSVTPPTTLDPSTTSAGVWLEANFDPRVGTAWVDIRTPDSSASGEGSGGQVLINLQTLPLVHNATTGRWELTWNGFTTAGRYDIFYNTVDAQTGEQSAPVQSTVYKNLAGNSPPAPFDLIYSDLVDPFSQDPRDFVPTWTPSSDPDGFSYTLQVATDQNFDNIVYSEADIQQEATIIPVTALLQDPTVAESYYCKNGDSYCSMRVLAVDSYGATTVSDTFRTFTLFDGNGSYAFITGYVVNAATNLPVAGAVVGTGSGATATTAANGSYILTRSSGNGYTLSVTAPGFQPSSVNIAAVAGINKVQFSLSSNLATPVNGLCGASNGQLFGSAPSANLCAAGSVSAAPAGAAPWSWSCAGSNGGSSASCTALSTQQIAVGTAAPASAPYNSQFTVAATASSGLAVSYSSGSPTVCNNSGASFTMLAASGSCVVQYDQGGNGSFGPATRVSSSVSAATASQSISFALPASAGYGDAAVSLSASASSGLSVSFHLVSGPGSISNNQLSITGAGVITVAADQGGSALYAAAPEQLRQITVAKAPLSVTADNQGRPFNTANPTLTASYSGFVNGDGAGALSGAPALATGATQSSPAGSYPITVSQGSLASANYSFTLVNGTLTVAPDTSAYPVTGNSGGNGTISCVSPVTAGNSTTCTLSPAPGYRVSSVSGCGSGVLNGTLYTTGVISGACTVSASFSAGSASGKPGDCNRDGMVTISEVQGAINMFLGLQAVGTCVDLDGSGTVSLSEVQQVINAFLGL